MRFTAQEEYGLRCALQMAKRDGEKPLTIADLAKLEGLTNAYVAKLMRVMRKGGVVVSVRGQSGGYRLARPPALMSAADVLIVLDRRLYQPSYCRQFAGSSPSCVHIRDCTIRALWRKLQTTLWHTLEQITLADLVHGGEREMLVNLKASLPVARCS